MQWFLLTCSLAVSLFLATDVGAEDGETDAATRRQQMITRIDELIEQRLVAEKVTPAERSSDSEFLRRVALDLTGVVPRVHVAREVLADDREDKRIQLVDSLLASPQHASHLANTWRNLLLPSGLSTENATAATGMQRWLRTRFASNLRYDNLVSDLLITTEGDTTGPALYFTSLELAPEKLAGSSARIFLGLQLDCAQCHDHPFDAWKQKDFWGYAAFFARLQRPDPINLGQSAQRVVDLDRGEVLLPNTEEVVLPKYIGGDEVNKNEPGPRRLQLAIWVASRDNPFLAPAAVNRVWHMLFGRGLVEPVDDLSPQNVASHPELFRELTDYFIATGFDLRELLRTLVLTETYQRTSRRLEADLPPTDFYAFHAVKSLSAEQLYESMTRVVGHTEPKVSGSGGESLDAERLLFLSKMQSPAGSPLDYHSGILQVLTLMNGSTVTERTTHSSSPLLQAIHAPWLSEPQQIERLFLATVCRFPTPKEKALLARELSAVESSERPAVLADALWAILNSAEFGLNH